MKLDIATGTSAKRKTWKNVSISWEDLVTKLSETHRTNETVKEYNSMNKQEKGQKKDVGGFVGGYLLNGRRKPENVLHRQLLTLDLDFADEDFWDYFCMNYFCEAVMHTTHSHCIGKNRFRLVVPLSREVTKDEYEAVARRFSSKLSIDKFDPTTFEVNRLMFWPSTPSDGEFTFEHQEGEILNPDDILATYTNWQDMSEWDYPTGADSDVQREIKKQQDPAEKAGIVGIFCRTYSIDEAIDNFLQDKYEKVERARYTYSGGTTAAGLITYEDTFAYSYHSSDPCCHRLSNAFDLVRIHKFGLMDEGKKNQNASFAAMEAFAMKQDEIKRTVIDEQIDASKYDFLDEPSEEDDVPEDWQKDLEFDSKGQFLNSALNITMILKYDEELRGCFKYNRFDNKRYVVKSLPWRKITEPDIMKDVDYSGIRNYIETVYNIASVNKIEDAIALEFNRNGFHPIQDYLRAVTWDGVKRIDNLLIDYFGAVDNIYTRESLRKSLVAAVARVFEPGKKFDNVLVLVGDQGVFKSTFFAKLGGEWFSDTFSTVQGKEAFEQLQGAWIIEMGELAGLRKAEVENIKHFISKQEDSYRPAYGRVVETFKRQCVFFGTTNNRSFLKDPTGNRRFMPIEVRPAYVTKDVWSKDFQESIHQIWAEAYHLYTQGETLYLSKEANDIANGVREAHSETDERTGLIEDFLNMKLPADWEELTIEGRRRYLDEPADIRAKGIKNRISVCVAEIWCECMGNKKEDMSKYNTRDLNDIMRNMPGWRQGGLKTVNNYGRQRVYEIDL